MQITEIEAFDYVVRHADAFAETAPLTEGEVLDLLDAARIADVNGVAPSEPEWVETYWLPKAVQSALELRALRASSQVDVTVDNMTIRGSQLGAALNRQAAVWRARCSASLPTGS